MSPRMDDEGRVRFGSGRTPREVVEKGAAPIWLLLAAPLLGAALVATVLWLIA